MFKSSTIALTACAWAVIAIPSAQAADLAPEPVPIAPVVLSGWYLRGDIGYTNQHVDKLHNALYDDYDSVHNVDKDFDSAPMFAAGVGYRWNNWLRTDVTGEYRGKSDFHGSDIGRIGPDRVPDDYTANKSEWLGLANAYLDLGTWHGISPFIGAGVGAANVEISDFKDVGTTVDSVAYGDDHDEWNLAWAVYAGVGLEITPAVTLELAYRYLDLGDAESGDLVTFDGTNDIKNPMKFEDITSHDIKVGVRYQFN